MVNTVIIIIDGNMIHDSNANNGDRILIYIEGCVRIIGNPAFILICK